MRSFALVDTSMTPAWGGVRCRVWVNVSTVGRVSFINLSSSLALPVFLRVTSYVRNTRFHTS